MALFRKKPQPLSFHDATCVAIMNCRNCRVDVHTTDIAFICDQHMPAAVQAGIVEEVIS